MLYLHSLFKFLNKIKSKYLKDSGAEGKGSQREKTPPRGFPGAATGDVITRRRMLDAWPLLFFRSPAPVRRGNQMKSAQTCGCLGWISKSHLPPLDVFFKAFPI